MSFMIAGFDGWAVIGCIALGIVLGLAFAIPAGMEEARRQRAVDAARGRERP